MNYKLLYKISTICSKEVKILGICEGLRRMGKNAQNSLSRIDQFLQRMDLNLQSTIAKLI